MTKPGKVFSRVKPQNEVGILHLSLHPQRPAFVRGFLDADQNLEPIPPKTGCESVDSLLVLFGLMRIAGEDRRSSLVFRFDWHCQCMALFQVKVNGRTRV